MPRLDRNGLKRYSITRIWNKKDQFQLGHIFEYKNEQAMKECLPIWKDIEQEFKDKIPNIAVGYRGILLDQYNLRLAVAPKHPSLHLHHYPVYTLFSHLFLDVITILES